MAYRTTWRWMFWSTSIFQAVMILVSFNVFKETYAPTILSRRAAELRKDTGDNRYYSEHERAMSTKSLTSILSQALSRPLRLLAFHPIIQLNAIISAFEYGVLYIVLASFAELWTKQYKMTVEMSGLHYLAIALGEVAGSQVGAPLMDAYYRRVKAQNQGGDPEPEHRLPLSLPGTVVGAVGLFVYGWVSEYRIHWAVVDIAIFIACFGMQTRGIAMQAYVMDAYQGHTSSAMAATQFLRSLTAFLFPLFAPIMYDKLGYGWGNSAVAFVDLALALPASVALWYFGAALRRKMPSTM
jgi:MFS family permease